MKKIIYNNIEPKIDSSAIIFDGVVLIGDVEIGKDCSIWFNSVLRGDVNFIKIGARSNIQDLTTIHVAYKDSNGLGGVEIGEDVTIGHNCIIHACKIEKFCLIGMGSVIMDYACIGEYSIVGANTLVTKGKVFPPKSLIMGNPAKIIRTLSDEEIKGNELSSKHYVEVAKSYKI